MGSQEMETFWSMLCTMCQNFCLQLVFKKHVFMWSSLASRLVLHYNILSQCHLLMYGVLCGLEGVPVVKCDILSSEPDYLFIYGLFFTQSFIKGYIYYYFCCLWYPSLKWLLISWDILAMTLMHVQIINQFIIVCKPLKVYIFKHYISLEAYFSYGSAVSWVRTEITNVFPCVQ